MDHNLVSSHSIEINTPAAKVWNVLTDPEMIKEYLYGTDTIADWKEGSPLTFEGEYNGTAYKDGGEILKNDGRSLLSYTYWTAFSGLERTAENHSVITYTLEDAGEGKTKFTWTQAGFVSKENMEHSTGGMPALLDLIKAIAER